MGFLKTEDGNYLLLEDKNKIILDVGTGGSVQSASVTFDCQDIFTVGAAALLQQNIVFNCIDYFTVGVGKLCGENIQYDAVLSLNVTNTTKSAASITFDAALIFTEYCGRKTPNTIFFSPLINFQLLPYKTFGSSCVFDCRALLNITNRNLCGSVIYFDSVASLNINNFSTRAAGVQFDNVATFTTLGGNKTSVRISFAPNTDFSLNFIRPIQFSTINFDCQTLLDIANRRFALSGINFDSVLSLNIGTGASRSVSDIKFEGIADLNIAGVETFGVPIVFDCTNDFRVYILNKLVPIYDIVYFILYSLDAAYFTVISDELEDDTE